MAYVKTEWVDHIKDINTGEVIQQGTAITANRLNKIEGALEVAYNAVEHTPGYGVEWDYENDTYKRIGQAEGLSRGDFDSIAPWVNMRRCVVDNDLNVLAYHGDPNYADGGALGQVMVEIKKFYVRVEQSDTVKRYWVNDKYSEGYEVHPAFVRDGEEIDAVYVGAYDASIYDVSDNKYLMDDEQVADFNADLLCSISGAKPASGQNQSLTLPNARKLANNRGDNWGLVDFDSINAAQLLYLVEYATFNSQAAIGQGVVNLETEKGDEGNELNTAVITGQTDFLGNTSGQAPGVDGEVSISYRGIENLWGNIWTWVDGLNIKNNRPYFNSIGINFVNDKFDGHYKDMGFIMPSSNGYPKNVGTRPEYPSAFLADEVGGSSSTYLTDYYYQTSGNRVADFGGSWASGAVAGAFFWDLAASSSSSGRSRGARLLAIPVKIAS